MSEFRDFREISRKFQDKLKKIKVFLADVDGILTDGRIFWAGPEVGFNRAFHALDGYGMKMLQRAGLKVGIISGGDSKSVKVRSDYLKLDYVFIGNEDKREALLTVMKDGFKPEEVCFMGDEFFDLPVLKKAGFSATVPKASPEIREAVDYVTQREGGDACVREVIDILRFAQGIVPDILEFEE
ncbi:MAG: HAD hydrolase family protein [Bacteriovoracaceae bacterium]|nr:HAD hydrolase family protein [Bacteriovoracaceae bacterium]